MYVLRTSGLNPIHKKKGKKCVIRKDKCYGVTNKYINELFKNYTILWCEKMEFDMQKKSGVVNWSSYDIIVIKI